MHRHALAAALALLFAGTSSASPIDVDWTRSFLLRGTGSGLENPLLQVAFNPQPEPPAVGLFGFADSGTDGYPPDPVITHQGAAEGDTFRLLFGISGDAPFMLGDGVFLDDGRFVQNILGGDPSSTSLRYVVEFGLTTTGGGVPTDWVMFNPQPEPPAIGAGAAAFGADFSFSTFSDVSLRLRVSDASGAPVSLQRVSEPASLWLLGLGLVGVLRLRRVASPKLDGFCACTPT